MKGQLVFEFIIAGLIFFAIILYTINYLNINVADFRAKFLQNRLQSKAVQVSEILMAGESNLSIADDFEFNLSKIQRFNNTYCNELDPQNITIFSKDFYLYEESDFGIYTNNANIELFVGDTPLLGCGTKKIPIGITKAEIGRVGIFQGEIAKLRVVVW